MNEEQLEEIIESLCEDVSRVGDDSLRFSQDESAQVYEAVAHHCVERANLIRSEIGE